MSARLEDKLTLAAEEGTKMVQHSSLAFYKDRYEDKHGKIRRLIHLRVERPSVSRQVSAYMSPTNRDVKTFLIKPKSYLLYLLGCKD